jgi:hypothetical protein
MERKPKRKVVLPRCKHGLEMPMLSCHECAPMVSENEAKAITKLSQGKLLLNPKTGRNTQESQENN